MGATVEDVAPGKKMGSVIDGEITMDGRLTFPGAGFGRVTEGLVGGEFGTTGSLGLSTSGFSKVSTRPGSF